MPARNIILNLPGFSIKKVSGYNPIILEVVYKKRAVCVHCSSKNLRKKDTYSRSIRHHSIGPSQTILKIKAHKFYCKNCNHYFNQRFPGLLKHQRATEGLKKQIFHQHTQGISQKALAVDFKLGKATIERWYHSEYLRLNKEMLNRNCPQVLGIDEHFFTQKEGFATTFCDLRRHKIFDVAKGRSAADLKHYLEQLPGKDNVKVVCMDLSSTYKSLVKHYFPNAKIVADRFHVIRLLNHQCLQTYAEIDPKIKNQRGLLAVLRTRKDRLKAASLEKRNAYLNQMLPIKIIEQFRERLYHILMKKTLKAKKCKRFIPVFLNMIKELKQSPFKRLAKLGKTLGSWKEEVVRMWRFSKSNGITEGFHRKMKLIQRRAYGFRNFENYRLRVKVLCGG
jgi:transposase